MNIHFPRPNDLTKASVWAFPQVVVCLDCGFSEFRIERPQLGRLAEESDEKEIAS